MRGTLLNESYMKIKLFFLQNEEAYICIYSKRDHDAILFTHEGGIDIGNVEEKAKTLILPVGEESALTLDSIKTTLLAGLDASKHE